MSAIAVVAAVAMLASCTVRVSGHASATTSAKAKAGAKSHPTVKAKPTDGPAAGGTASAGAAASAKVSIGIKVPKVAQGAKAQEAACPNTTEVTNGIDDDCDGQIDENEVGSGPLQITLWWEGTSDLDLKVQPPGGKQIDYENKKAAGGFMDKDSRSSCKKTTDTIENVYWTDSPPKGVYTVLVKYYSNCGVKPPPATTANVAVSYKGQVLGPYQLQMNKGEEVELLQFNLEE
jgi:uncharacterized protein YfaP (DUF2135 family)